MTNTPLPTTATQIMRSYTSGWEASGNDRWDGNMDAAEANWLRRGHTPDEHTAWIAGWSDYASDADLYETMPALPGFC